MLLWTLLVISLLLSSLLWLTHDLGLIGQISQATQDRFEAQQNLVKAHKHSVLRYVQGLTSLHHIPQREGKSPQHRFACLGLKACRLHQKADQCWVWSVVSRADYGFNHKGKVVLSVHYESPAPDNTEHASCWHSIRRIKRFKVLYWLE